MSMISMLWVALVALGAYLLGSIPTGLLVARTRGIDIRKVGSGNIGATNVFRSVSKPLGILVFIGDFLKGLIPALVGQHFGGPGGALALGFCAIAGHNWPVFLKFKGGKGVATSAGVLLGLAPAALGVGFVAWLITFLVSRYVSLASMAAAIGTVAGGWYFYVGQTGSGWLLPTALSVLGALVIWKHRSNIQRLLAGTEHRFNFKK